jgi:sugar phosphate isomerase/epimerase
MLLLSTSSLAGYGLHRIFQIVKEAWYDGIDLCVENELLDTWDEEYINSLVREFSIPVVSISAPSTKLDETKVDKLIEIAQRIWSQVITFSPPHISDKNTKWFRNYLPKVAKWCEISLAIQNVPPKFLFFIIPEYKNSTLDQIKKITGSTTLDIGWIDSSSGIDIMKAQQLLGSTIRNILISDKDVTREWLLPGKSAGGASYLPLESFFITLRNTWYAHSISLRVDSKELWAGDISLILSSLENFKKYYSKYFLNIL